MEILVHISIMLCFVGFSVEFPQGDQPDYTAHRSTTPATTPALIPTTVSTKIVTLYPHATLGPLKPSYIHPNNYGKYENTDMDYITQRPRGTPYPSRPVHAGQSFSASKSLCIGNLMLLCSDLKSTNNCCLTTPSTYVIAISFVFFHQVLQDMFH